jgi:predicted dehydrogenase
LLLANVNTLKGNCQPAGMQQTKVGIIGAGLISQFQAVAYAKVANAKIEAVCDIDRRLAEKKAKEWGASKAYGDYNQLLADSSIDAVEILLPHQLHRPVVIAAAEKGKQVSVMKPMALNSKDARDMIAAAARNNVLLNVSENYLFYEPISKAIEVIKAGGLGTPLTIRMERVPSVGGSEKYAEPNDPEYWRQDKRKSGGMVFDDMVHYDAVARFMMGSDIQKITALLENPGMPYELPAVVGWKHKADQAYGEFVYSWVLRTAIPTDYYSLHESVEVICEEGIVWIPNISAKLLTGPPLVVYADGKMTSYDVNPDYQNSFVREVQHFVDSVRKGTKTMFNGEEAHKQVLFAAAIQKSADQGRVVELTEVEGLGPPNPSG